MGLITLLVKLKLLMAFDIFNDIFYAFHSVFGCSDSCCSFKIPRRGKLHFLRNFYFSFSILQRRFFTVFRKPFIVHKFAAFSSDGFTHNNFRRTWFFGDVKYFIHLKKKNRTEKDDSFASFKNSSFYNFHSSSSRNSNFFHF